MVSYRKILLLHQDGMSQRAISESVGSSRQTVRKVIEKAEGKTSIHDDMTDADVKSLLFPEKQQKVKGIFRKAGHMYTKN